MKNVFLIGDSIRFGAGENSPGYGVYVKKKLEGKANVYAPDENCRFAQYTLRYLGEWASRIEREKIDVVHWNNGLWDALRLNGDAPFTPLPFYEDTIERIYKKLTYFFPNAKIIFALSTGVIEEWANPDFMRYNREIEQYNEAAKKVLSKYNVPINDLYTISRGFEDSMHSDWVHYGAEGSEILADAVVKAIDRVLE